MVEKYYEHSSTGEASGKIGRRGNNGGRQEQRKPGVSPATEFQMIAVFPEHAVTAGVLFDNLFGVGNDNSWVVTTRDYILRTAQVFEGEVATIEMLGLNPYQMPILEMAMGSNLHVFIPVREGSIDEDWKLHQAYLESLRREEVQTIHAGEKPGKYYGHMVAHTAASPFQHTRG